MANSTNENLQLLFSKMNEFVKSETVVGEPIVMGDVTLIPMIDVSFGMATGITTSKEEESPKNKGKNGGAGGLGAKMSPSAVIVVTNGTAQLISLKTQESTNKLIDMIPGVLSKLNLGGLFKKKEEAPEAEDDLVIVTPAAESTSKPEAEPATEPDTEA